MTGMSKPVMGSSGGSGWMLRAQVHLEVDDRQLALLKESKKWELVVLTQLFTFTMSAALNPNKLFSPKKARLLPGSNDG